MCATCKVFIFIATHEVVSCKMQACVTFQSCTLSDQKIIGDLIQILCQLVLNHSILFLIEGSIFNLCSRNKSKRPKSIRIGVLIFSVFCLHRMYSTFLDIRCIVF
jgi:hypothetical protein